MPAWESDSIPAIHFGVISLEPTWRFVQARLRVRNPDLTSSGSAMEFYTFVRGCLAWTATVEACFPLNVPMLYFAYRIREGRVVDEDTRMENDELWKRSALGAAVLAAMMVAFVFADVVLARWGELPAGITHFVLFLAYVAAGAYVVMYFFAYDDYFQGLGQLTLYLAIPIFVLWALTALLGWNPIAVAESFLQQIPAEQPVLE